MDKVCHDASNFKIHSVLGDRATNEMSQSKPVIIDNRGSNNRYEIIGATQSIKV